MSRIDRFLIGAGAVIVIVVPVPFFLRGSWPWRFHGLLVTDLVGFGLLGLVVARGVWRAERARRRALASMADVARAERLLAERLDAMLRRRGDPKGRTLS